MLFVFGCERLHWPAACSSGQDMFRYQVVALLVSIGASSARAEAVSGGDVVGHFPFVEVGAIAGLTSTSLPESVESEFGGLAGVGAQLHLDLHRALVNVEGAYNLSSGDLAWMTRGEIILGSGLGLRSKHNLVKSIQDSTPDSSGRYTRTTEYYVHKHVPLFVGLAAGLSFWRLSDSSGESATVPAFDVDFAVRSPQWELVLGPQYEFATGSLGLHISAGLALPVGSRLLFARFVFDTHPGERMEAIDRRLDIVALFALGTGASIGL